MPGCLFSTPPIFRWRFDLITPTSLRRHVEWLHRFDVEGRSGRRWESKNPLPQTVKAQKELDLIPPDHRSCRLHRALAARADHRILSPDLPDEIPPEGTQRPLALRLGRREDEEGCRAGFCRFRLRSLSHRWPRPPRAGVHAAPFVRVEAVIAHGLLSLRRDMLDGGGEEVGDLEDLEVLLGVPAALGSVDDFPGRGAGGCRGRL